MVNSAVTFQENHILPILLEGAQELLGTDSLQAVLALCPAASAAPNGSMLGCAGLPGVLEAQYGVLGGRGLALRIGRSSFKYLLQRHGNELGLNSADFHLQRAPQRMKSGLHLLASQVTSDSSDRITISDDDTHWVWRSERCPVCWGRQENSACCYLTVGLIQEFLSWAGGGRFYKVVENECRATGDPACSFWVEKKPLD